MSQPSSSPRFDSVLWLIGGLFLGMVLVLAGVLLWELAMGRDLLGSGANPRFAAESEKLRDELNAQREEVRKLQQASAPGRDLQVKLNDAQRQSARDSLELQDLRERVKKQEQLLERADDMIRDLESKLREKNGDAHTEHDDVNDVEEGVAENQLKKARQLSYDDRNEAIKMLRKMVADHPKTRAAKEASKLLDDVNRK